MIILLSDGQMSGDTRNLTEVLNMPQMEGVVRYAIGVSVQYFTTFSQHSVVYAVIVSFLLIVKYKGNMKCKC